MLSVLLSDNTSAPGVLVRILLGFFFCLLYFGQLHRRVLSEKGKKPDMVYLLAFLYFSRAKAMQLEMLQNWPKPITVMLGKWDSLTNELFV